MLDWTIQVCVFPATISRKKRDAKRRTLAYNTGLFLGSLQPTLWINQSNDYADIVTLVQEGMSDWAAAIPTRQRTSVAPTRVVLVRDRVTCERSSRDQSIFRVFDGRGRRVTLDTTIARLILRATLAREVSDARTRTQQTRDLHVLTEKADSCCATASALTTDNSKMSSVLDTVRGNCARESEMYDQVLRDREEEIGLLEEALRKLEKKYRDESDRFDTAVRKLETKYRDESDRFDNLEAAMEENIKDLKSKNTWLQSVLNGEGVSFSNQVER